MEGPAAAAAGRVLPLCGGFVVTHGSPKTWQLSRKVPPCGWRKPIPPFSGLQSTQSRCSPCLRVGSKFWGSYACPPPLLHKVVPPFFRVSFAPLPEQSQGVICCGWLAGAFPSSPVHRSLCLLSREFVKECVGAIPAMARRHEGCYGGHCG